MKLKNIATSLCVCICLEACQSQFEGEVRASLDYCHQQVERTLSELKSRESGIDYMLTITTSKHC